MSLSKHCYYCFWYNANELKCENDLVSKSLKLPISDCGGFINALSEAVTDNKKRTATEIYLNIN